MTYSKIKCTQTNNPNKSSDSASLTSTKYPSGPTLIAPSKTTFPPAPNKSFSIKAKSSYPKLKSSKNPRKEDSTKKVSSKPSNKELSI